MALWHNGAEEGLLQTSPVSSVMAHWLLWLLFITVSAGVRQDQPPEDCGPHLNELSALLLYVADSLYTLYEQGMCLLFADDCFVQQTDIRGEARSIDQGLQWRLIEMNSCRWSHGNIDLSFSITSHWFIRTDVIKLQL